MISPGRAISDTQLNSSVGLTSTLRDTFLTRAHTHFGRRDSRRNHKLKTVRDIISVDEQEEKGTRPG